MIHGALFFAFAAPVVLIGLVLFAIALCKAGDEEFDAQHRSQVGLSENDVSLCQSRQRSRRLTVMAGAASERSYSKRASAGETAPPMTGKEPRCPRP